MHWINFFLKCFWFSLKIVSMKCHTATVLTGNVGKFFKTSFLPSVQFCLAVVVVVCCWFHSLCMVSQFLVFPSLSLQMMERWIYIKDYKKENHWLGDGVKVHNLKSKPHAFSCTQIKFLFKSKTIISWTIQAFTGQAKTLVLRNYQSHIISVWNTSN